MAPDDLDPPPGPDADDEQDFAAWIDAGHLPELKAVVQRRSIRTAHALIQSGFQLLRSRSFEALSVQDICAAADATEGAFYGRFADKRSFFTVLQRITCLRSERALGQFLAQVHARPPGFDDLCRLIVTMTVTRFRAHASIFRAALQHADEGAWEPFRQLGDRYRQALTGLLAPHLRTVPAALRPLRVQFAFQVVVGTLVHATLNDPGPLHLQDDALVDELTAVLIGYLRSAPAG